MRPKLIAACLSAGGINVRSFLSHPHLRSLTPCLLLLLASACSTASFSGKAASKRGSQGGVGGEPERQGPAVDCTGLNEQQCLNKKKEENTNQSFRTVDCSQKSQEACEQLTQQTRTIDGRADSDIRVVPCQQANGCTDTNTNTNTDTNIATTTSTDTSTTTSIGTSGGEIALGDIKYCAGGPYNAVFPFRTEAEAVACYDNVRRGGVVNGSMDCRADARYGKCSYKGTLDAARKARSPAAIECECLRTTIATVPGLSWDGVPKKK